jgi:alpha-beta hydrolase superfamily lysophospholipase
MLRFQGPRARRGLFAVVLLLLALAGCQTLDQQQRRWIFQPSDRSWGQSAAAADGLQDVWIDFNSRETGEPARLHGLWLPAARDDAPVLLYLHGARWDVRGSAWRMRRMQELGFAVLGIDYRGFGRSTPQLPSETLAYEDARAAWDWLAAQRPQARRFVFGHSLGGAIAVHLASEVHDAAGLMVEGSFTSIPDVFSSFKWGWLPVGPLITQRFDAAERIARTRTPVLVVHGSDDRLIPPALGRALYERAPGPKRFVLVEGGTHHNTNGLAQDQYRAALGDLFGLSLTR